MIWTAQMDDAMRNALASGVSYGAFAEAQGLSRNSVLGRALRLRRNGIVGFGIRDCTKVERAKAPKPRERNGSPKPIQVIAPRPRPMTKARTIWIPEYDRTAGLPLFDRTSPDRVGNSVDLIDLKPRDCRWPDARGTYCGEPISRGSYCEFHYHFCHRDTRGVKKFRCEEV
jgi:hypothetical protein